MNVVKKYCIYKLFYHRLSDEDTTWMYTFHTPASGIIQMFASEIKIHSQ